MKKDYDANCIHKLALDLCSGSVLSIGCGYGREVSYLAKKGCKVTAVDIDEKTIRSNKEPSAKYFCGDFLYFKTKKKFDCAVCLWNTLLYVPDRRFLIYHAMEMLKPNGKLVVTISKMTLKRYLWNKVKGINYYAFDSQILDYFKDFKYTIWERDKTYLIIVEKQK